MEIAEAKEKLKKKLRSQRNKRMAGRSNEIPDDPSNILNMMDQVNRMLKTNPELIKQVNKCVKSVMNDKTLMDSITGKIQGQTVDTTSPGEVNDVNKCLQNMMNDKNLMETLTGKIQDHTLDNSDDGDDTEASSNEFKQ